MSTFTYDSYAPILRDSTVVQHFRVNPPDEYLTRLNLDLGTSLTVQDFLRIQVYFANTALRDPTVGELRLLDAIVGRNHYTSDRIAVGELTTHSPALAETWADMVAKHRALTALPTVSRADKKQAPLCSLIDALNLTGRYLYRANLRPSEDTLILSTPRQEAVATAEGYEPVARMKVGRGVRSLWKRRSRILDETPCRTGDIILYLPRLTLSQASALIAAEANKRRASIGAIRALTEKSLLATILDLCPAADLHAARLPGAGQNGADIPHALLCDHPSVAADGACGYVLRVPLKQMPDATRILQEQNIPFITCGQARLDGNLTVMLPDVSGLGEYAAVSLPPDLLQVMSGPRPCAMTPEALTPPVFEAAHPPISRLPSVDRESGGLTPDGRETVALTLLDGEILTIPEANTKMTALTVEIPMVEAAYSSAAEATASAALILEKQGIPPSAIRLSVSMTVSDRDMLTDGPALAAICGVYCAAAGLAVPVEDSVVETAPAPMPLTVTVTAWAKAPHDEAPTEDRQWRAAGETAAKAPLGYVLPVLRRVYEGSLLALSSALNRQQNTDCALRPLAVSSITDEETGAVHYALHPDSLRKLQDELSRDTIPVVSMNRDDTRLLLSHPEVAIAFRQRAEVGRFTLVLGESCAVFAEYGLLPEALAQAAPLPWGGHTATAAYSFPAEPATRLFRADPLAAVSTAAAMDTRHLLELTLPDGTVIPDGFISDEGKTLGLLNGLDTTLLTRFQQFGLYLP